ncbi:S-adenosyl-L-methionine-dependent methyltransferase [Xylaria longipes]|nr:S-adenosyl-L-methionine-dependent methyltransferase [Xylaria longipes]
MDSILGQLHTLVPRADNAGRYRILDGIRELQLQLETPHDTLSRLSGLHLELAVARIGADLGVFKILKESEQPLSTMALSEATNAAPLNTHIANGWCVGRLLRYLASVGMIREVARDSFAANAITKTLAQSGYEGGIRHFFDNVGPVLQAFPEFLSETKYQDAFSTDLPAFMWLPTQLERFPPLQQVMTVQGASGVPWFFVFPFEKELGSFTGAHTFVDVGGGFALHGKIVLEDLPQTFEQLPFKLDGIEPKPHNFFEAQPIKGARFYYLRNILHDWPDEKCVAILYQLINASRPDSQILIDEMVLPDGGVSWEATTIDLTLMATFGSRERTTAQWHALLDTAGLKVLRIDTYHDRRRDSIIQAIAK